MKDQITVKRVALLHPKIIPGFTGFINDAEAALDITIRMVQGLRTWDEQQVIYNQGRTMPGAIVTKAKPGQTYHNYGLAGDIVPFLPGGISLDWEYPFEKLVPFAIKYGITWGGYFPSPDRDHFENKFGYDWRDLLKKYQAGDFIPGTKFVNL